jgi:hypothetical protein
MRNLRNKPIELDPGNTGERIILIEAPLKRGAFFIGIYWIDRINRIKELIL